MTITVSIIAINSRYEKIFISFISFLNSIGARAQAENITKKLLELTNLTMSILVERLNLNSSSSSYKHLIGPPSSISSITSSLTCYKITSPIVSAKMMKYIIKRPRQNTKFTMHIRKMAGLPIRR